MSKAPNHINISGNRAVAGLDTVVVQSQVRVYIYMVIDLKVLVRSFNCESRACYVGNPRESFFRIRESKILFRESFAKVGYYNHYM